MKSPRFSARSWRFTLARDAKLGDAFASLILRSRAIPPLHYSFILHFQRR